MTWSIVNHPILGDHSSVVAQPTSYGPFEGPEKLLEIWFAPSPAHVPGAVANGDNNKLGLRAIDRQVWEDMLDIVQCKILNVIHGTEMDAYLLSESSFFVAPHRVILKTCGTTLNLLGLPRILSIARHYANFPSVYRCFYSRKSFMFPDKQLGPHKDWAKEIEFLDTIFDNGSAYTVGKVNGDHWLLYLTTPGDTGSGNESLSSSISSLDIPIIDGPVVLKEDVTFEILMTKLSERARSRFINNDIGDDQSPTTHGQEVSYKIGIKDIFPSHLTSLDAYSFSPCGYSANAFVSSEDGDDKGYYTIHVTPEEGWSYASFECSVPVSTRRVHDGHKNSHPDLETLIQRVVRIFEPGKITLTLFVSSSGDDMGEPAVETAQRAFKKALLKPWHQGRAGGIYDADSDDETSFAPSYKRTDKINYEFGGYDLAFASFELKD